MAENHLPGGSPRCQPNWPPRVAGWKTLKAFLGKPADASTGLTHVGAREYDPSIGQFISVDPILAVDQHQSLNGYAYANNTPVTFSDPTGLCMDPGNGHCMPDDGGKLGHQKPDKRGAPPPYDGPYDGTRESVGLGGGTASTDSSGNTSSGSSAACWPIYTCGAKKGPADNINNMGNAGGPDIPSFFDSFVDSFTQGPLAALLSGDLDEAWDRLNPDCPNPAVCEPATGTFDVAGSSLLARAATKATSKELAAQVEVMFAKQIAGKRRAALAGRLEIEGNSSMLLLATSGKHEQIGLVPTVGGKGNPARYTATSTGNNGRVNDTEYKMLTYIANQLGAPSKVKGSLTLHSSQEACFSCTPVIGQFAKEFPNIRINYTSGRQ
ncbi:RHS repeat-associated core domain-containing protein [Streptomyces luteogriseus]|uniref:RHS repeat-associated core domain-containing protein n=1 Tax=Streptomyces luteogriseus TaxID=68233 RepID=UPI00369D9292